MFDKDAIEALQYGGGINEASEAVHAAFAESALVSLPNHFTVHDLEKYLPNRRRPRGVMQTQIIEDFAQYVSTHQTPGASVFIDVENMKAVGVLNLGTTENPGHADDKAIYTARATAAYLALKSVASGQPISQVKAAEFLEDWLPNLNCTHEGEFIPTIKAIQAVREITIEGLRKVGNTEGQLSAARTTFEEVKASGKEQIPTLIEFFCEPYVGLERRTFAMRLGIQTGGDKPALVLRIVKQEEHQEQMGRELASLLGSAIATSSSGIPVLLGSYAPSN